MPVVESFLEISADTPRRDVHTAGKHNTSGTVSAAQALVDVVVGGDTIPNASGAPIEEALL